MGDFALREVEVDYEEGLKSCVHESFFMEYTPEHDVFAFEDQCDDSLQASVLTSLSSILPSSHEAPPNVLLSSSFELKPLPNTLKYAFLGLNETFCMILANDLNLNQETQVLDLLRKNKEVLGWILGEHCAISPTIVQHLINLEDNAKPYRDR